MIENERIQAAIERYFAANNALDADAVGDLFAPDARMHRLPGTPATTGREAIRQAYRQIFGTLSRAEVHPAHTYI